MNGSCRAADGSVCSADSDCGQGSSCVLHYADSDGDGFAVVGAATQGFCLSGNSGVSGFTRQQPGAVGATDCLEGNGDVHPGQARDFDVGVAQNPNGPFDYDCNGVEESANPVLNALQDCSNPMIPDCSQRGSWVTDRDVPGAPGVPACGQEGYISPCIIQSDVCGGFAGGPAVRRCH